MRKLIVLAAITALGSIAVAQNFNPIKSDRFSFLKCNSESLILPIMVDSITTDGLDTIYHFYKTWDYQKATGYGWSEDECVKPEGPSWIGHQAIYKQDGRFLFTNYENDTLTLKPFAEIDSTWVFYSFANGDELWATVDSVCSLQVLGINSLLKYISFKRKDPQGVLHPYFPTDLGIVISDSLGFVNVFPFRSLFDEDWEYNLWGNYNIPFDNYTLIGLTNPRVGHNLISNVSIYDFDVDDEFHYSSSYMSGMGTGSFVSEQSQRISLVTDKTFSSNNDSIFYTFHNVRKVLKYEYDYVNPVITYSEYTSTFEVRIVDTTYYLPDKAIVDEMNGDRHYNQRLHPNNRMRIIPLIQPNIMFDEEYYPCWRLVWGSKHGTSESRGYGQGIGYLGYYYESSFSQGSLALVYFKKGDETWGAPLVISSVPSNTINSFRIYPNPISKGNNVNIEPNNEFSKYSITLINSTGFTVKQWDNIYGNYAIPISGNISSGIYFLLIKTSNGRAFTKKLVVY